MLQNTIAVMCKQISYFKLNQLLRLKNTLIII